MFGTPRSDTPREIDSETVILGLRSRPAAASRNPFVYRRTVEDASNSNLTVASSGDILDLKAEIADE